MRYSGAARRLTAFVVDLFVILGIFMAFGLILGLSVLSSPLLALPMVGFWFYGGMFAITWGYFAGLESSAYQATVGKKLLGLKVVSYEGKRIGFWRATLRYFSKGLSRLLFMVGFLMIVLTEKKQGLHDKIASTVVIIQRGSSK